MINIDARAYETKTDEQILAEMQQMQDRITETLIIEDNKYIYDLDIAIIMEEVYKYTKGYNKCLEAFIYRYIKNNAIEKIKPYIEDIVSYYTEEKIITDCCMIIVKTIYKYNYYETLNYEKIKLFKNN